MRLYYRYKLFYILYNIDIKKKVVVNDKMQKDYTYYLTEPIGENFAEDFKPELTPKQKLELGVFGRRQKTDR